MVTLAYLDTSAAVKLVLDEPESEAVLDYLDALPDLTLASSWLLHTELYCAVGRRPGAISADAVDRVLRTVVLTDLTRGDLIAAGSRSPLRSHDAIHLAVAMRIGADEVITYDSELAEASQRAGIAAKAPS